MTGAPASGAAATQLAAAIDLIVIASGQSLLLVDAATNRVTASIPVGVPLRSVAIAPDGRTAWTFGVDPAGIDVHLVDLTTRHVETERLTDVPRQVAFTSDGQRAFVSLDRANAVAFLDAINRNNLGQVVLGRQTAGMQMRRHLGDLAIVHTPAGDVLYVAGYGSGAVWALDGDTGSLLKEIEVGGGPSRLLADASSRRIFAVLDTVDQLVAIDTLTQQIVDRQVLPGRPSDAAISQNGVIFIAGEDSQAVWVVDSPVAGTWQTIPFGGGPTGVAFSPDGRRAYVSTRKDGALSVVEASTQNVIARVPVGPNPVTVAVAGRAGSATLTAALSSSTLPQAARAPLPTPQPAATPTPAQLPSGTVQETFVPGANFPVTLAFAPDGRLFYSELRTGRIRIVQNGVLLPDPFYSFHVANYPETGLIGLTLDPDFRNNHYVYAMYTQDLGRDVAGPNQVVRLTDVNGRGTGLRSIIRDLPSGPIHNAGRLRFGPDGKLYVSLGENDVIQRAQDLSSPAGKILRVNPDGSIPVDNPFVKHLSAYPAIWAYGLRNAAGLDFHPITGIPFVTENGPGDNDELDLIVKGGNYGWPPTGYKDTPGIVDPLAVFNPPIGPVGLAFYRGTQFPEWTNDLFYCNYHQGQLRRVRLAPESFDRVVYDEIVVPGGELDVTTGPDGALYFSDVSNVYRIRRIGASALAAVATAENPASVPTETPPAGTRPQDRDMDVDLLEWKITLSRTTVPAGDIRLVVANLGATVHALRIVGNGLDVRTKDLDPRQTSILELKLSPGTYQLTCPIGDHAQMGMVASLTVVGH